MSNTSSADDPFQRSVLALALGKRVSLIAVLLVILWSAAILSGLISRATNLKEDATFAGSYLASLALGVLIVSMHGSNIDLPHVLFGTILAIDDSALNLMGGIASITALALAGIYRPLILECFDPGFLKAVGGKGSLFHFVFLVLVVLNLVAGFQALGTLMAVGLMMLPALAARFWAASVPGMMAVAAGCCPADYLARIWRAD